MEDDSLDALPTVGLTSFRFTFILRTVPRAQERREHRGDSPGISVEVGLVE
jgi:hypothetical protein